MATLLLISFAVAIGVVIMNFGRAQVESEAQCAIDVGMHFSNIGGSEQMCYDSSKSEIYFTIENGVNIKVEGLIVNVIGTQQADTYTLDDAKMDKSGIYVGHVRYDKAVKGDIRQIKISPKVVLYDEEIICQEKSITIENVKAC